MRTRQGVLDVLDRPKYATPIARMLGPERASKMDLVKAVAEMRRVGLVDGDYFGLRRNGEYIVSYGVRKT